MSFKQVQVTPRATAAPSLEAVKTAVAEVAQTGRLVTRGPGQVSCPGVTGEVSWYHLLFLCFCC